MLQTVLLVLHVIVAIALITFILLQQGRGATAGAAFGSGASSTVFGARGSASFLSRTTSILAIVFFSNCLALAFLGGQRQGPQSVLDHLVNEQAPAASSDAPPMPAPDTTAATTPGETAATPSPTITTPAPVATPPAPPAANDRAADLPQIPPNETTP